MFLDSANKKGEPEQDATPCLKNHASQQLGGANAHVVEGPAI